MQLIDGLVTRRSSITATSANPLVSGLRQSYLYVVWHYGYAATKPKARSPMGFLLCGRDLALGVYRVMGRHEGSAGSRKA